jgi:hypothetical protein
MKGERRWEKGGGEEATPHSGSTVEWRTRGAKTNEMKGSRVVGGMR